MRLNTMRSQLLRRHVALPGDHGSWVFLLSPLLIGLSAGGQWSVSSLLLSLAAMAAFLLRQPLAIAVKAYSGRRGRDELPAAWFWAAFYAAVGLAAVSGLLVRGQGYVLWLALPAVPVFGWHLLLVSRRAERRQMGVEVVASGVLALAAPAAYWVEHGGLDAAGWWLWGLTWFQSAGSIVYAYTRLEQRVLTAMPARAERWRLGWRGLAYTTFNLLAAGTAAALGWLPTWIWAPYALQWTETVWGTLVRPAVGMRPTTIGVRQLIVSSLFTLLFILAW